MRRRSKAVDQTTGQVPACLLMGPVPDVWCPQPVPEVNPRYETHLRWSAVREWWLNQAGIDEHAGWTLIPSRSGRVTLDPREVPRLRNEAIRLLTMAGVRQ